MGLPDELEPILEEIRAQAENRYRFAMSEVPGKDLDPEWFARDHRNYMGSVDDLLNRFREFYVLDQHDFQTNLHLLTRPSEEKPKLGDSVPLVNCPSPFTVFGKIFFADVNYVRPVLELIYTEQWNSPAATAFHNEFLVPFREAADWQGAYVKELGLAAEMFRSTADAARKGIKTIAQGCLSALNYQQLFLDGDSGDWHDALGALSLFTAAVALLLPASPAAVVVGGISLASGLAGQPPRDDKPNLLILFDDGPQNILIQTERAISELWGMVFDMDDTIAAGLETDLESTDRFVSPNLRPGTAILTASMYSRLDIKDADGLPPDQVVVSILQLARAGYANMPGAAREYSSAISDLDAGHVPDVMTKLFPRSIGKFNAAVGLLTWILYDTRDRLTRAGEAMVEAARAYRGTDEENAAIIKGINEAVEI